MNLQPTQITIETGSSAISNGQIIESISIETFGGTFFPIIHKGANVPTEMSQTFSTSDNNQAFITLKIYRGNSVIASFNKMLCQLYVKGIAPSPRASHYTQVTHR